ncbi:MAG: ribbon-helix-helix protein, CopG family [Desulfuromonadales bacterium]|nr:ribbon-helix-helix protein, CopG family [Desulfuromonadales bacterium]
MPSKGAPRKAHILSVRVTDGEMEQLQELMELARMSASELMREALLAYGAKLERMGRPPALRQARAA